MCGRPYVGSSAPMMDERPVGQPTMDRRIERLERDFAKLEKDLALMSAEQTHLRELVTTRFAESATSQARIEGKLDGFNALLTAASTDPAASPLGRALTTDIVAATVIATEAKTIAQGVDRKLVQLAAAIGVIAWLAGLIGPIVARYVVGMTI